jgi:hypothetical protein
MRRRLPVLAIVTAAVIGGIAPATAAQRPVVTQKVLRQGDPKGAWQFSYKYPQISVPGALMGVRGICQDFNQQMRKEADQSLKEFREEVAKNASSPVPIKAKSQKSVDYVVVTRRPGLQAYKFTQFEYLRGQAHPLTTVFTRNFDMRGQFVKLPDLFAPDSHYLEKIASVAKSQLTAQANKKQFKIIEPKGYAANAENFQNFVITGRGLEIIFNPYQVAPGYVGILSATVPWSALQSDLSDQGRLIRQSASS